MRQLQEHHGQYITVRMAILIHQEQPNPSIELTMELKVHIHGMKQQQQQQQRLVLLLLLQFIHENRQLMITFLKPRNRLITQISGIQQRPDKIQVDFFPTNIFDKIINVQPFKNLKVRLAKNVILRTTTNFNDHQVKLSCPNYAIDFLATELHGDTLSITTTGDCDVLVQSSQFERLDFGAVQVVTAENDLNGNRLSIVTGGQTTIYLSSIHYDAVDVMMLGENHLVLTGSTRVLDVTQLGTGAFDSRQLISDTVQVFSRNSGLISVKSTNFLSLFVSKIANIIWCSPRVDFKTDSLTLPNPPNILRNCQ